MCPQRAVTREGKKFVWDGRPYATQEEASGAVARYEQDRFEVWQADEEGSFLVYTRRPVIETAPPS